MSPQPVRDEQHLEVAMGFSWIRFGLGLVRLEFGFKLAWVGTGQVRVRVRVLARVWVWVRVWVRVWARIWVWVRVWAGFGLGFGLGFGFGFGVGYLF